MAHRLYKPKHVEGKADASVSVEDMAAKPERVTSACWLRCDVFGTVLVRAAWRLRCQL